MDRRIFPTNKEQIGANRFGLWLFLIALAILFAAALLAMLAIRLETSDWPDDLPPLPAMLWWSTGVLLASTATIQVAVWMQRRQRGKTVARLLAVGLALSIVFLVLQTLAWFDWVSSFNEAVRSREVHRMAQTGFLVLTGLHGAHIIGGLIPLALVVWYAAVRGVSTAALQSVSIYWHFLDVVWIILVLFMVLVL